MTRTETELQNFLSQAAAEVEARAWNVENAERRTSFMTRRLAALAIQDYDPLSDEAFEDSAA